MRWTGQLGVRWQQPNGPIGITTHLNYNHQDGAREFIGGGLVSYKARDENNPSREFTLYSGMFYDAQRPDTFLEASAGESARPVPASR